MGNLINLMIVLLVTSIHKVKTGYWVPKHQIYYTNTSSVTIKSKYSKYQREQELANKIANQHILNTIMRSPNYAQELGCKVDVVYNANHELTPEQEAWLDEM